MKYKRYDLGGYQVYTIATDKFKNCYMEINFRQDVKNVSLAKRRLLGKMLAESSLKYPSKREVNIALEELYNLEFSSGVGRIGHNHLTSFSFDFLHPKYVKEKDYLDHVLDFAFDTLLKPNIKNGSFDEVTLQVVKEKSHVSLDAYKERPLSFARIDSLAKLYKGEIPSKRAMGTHEEIDEVTAKDLSEEYKKLFAETYTEILVIGNLDMDLLVEKIKNRFTKEAVMISNIPYMYLPKIAPFKQEIVKSTYNQTQYLVYYQFNNLTKFEKECVVPLFSIMLGNANMTDKLTRYLRIENSLCYYCGFYVNTSDGYGMFYVGLNKENIVKAREMIQKAMQEMIQKDIEEDYFEIQKEKYLADLKIREDGMYSLGDNYYLHETFGFSSFQELREEIPKVTLEDIQNLGKKMQYTYEYILEEREA